jgi:hypothetical protein
VIAEGKNLEEIKQEVDRWHLKKNLKKLRRDEEVRGIRFDEIWHYVPGLLNKIEVGNSLFGSSSASMVYVYAGLRTEGRKIVRTVFEDPEMAWKSTLDVFKALFVWKAKYDFFFREKLILEMEKKYEKYLYGIDLLQVLQEALWKKLDFEGRFGQPEKIRDLEFVKAVFEEQKGQLEQYKKKILSALEKAILKMEKLAASEQTEDLQELAAIKKQIQKGEF